MFGTSPPSFILRLKHLHFFEFFPLSNNDDILVGRHSTTRMFSNAESATNNVFEFAYGSDNVFAINDFHHRDGPKTRTPPPPRRGEGGSNPYTNPYFNQNIQAESSEGGVTPPSTGGGAGGLSFGPVPYFLLSLKDT